MNPVIIPHKQSQTLLCFLLLIMASKPWRTWAQNDDLNRNSKIHTPATGFEPVLESRSVSVPPSVSQDQQPAALQTEEPKAESAAHKPVPEPATGLAKLRQELASQNTVGTGESEPISEDTVSQINEDASNNPAFHKDKVKYASGLWVAANKLDSSRSPTSDHRGSKNDPTSGDPKDGSTHDSSRKVKRSTHFDPDDLMLDLDLSSPHYHHGYLQQHHHPDWKSSRRAGSNFDPGSNFEPQHLTHNQQSSSKSDQNHHHNVPSSPLSSSKSSLSSTLSADESADAAAAFSIDSLDPMTAHLRSAGRDMARQMMKRRNNVARDGRGRMYDVPQIGKI